MKKILLCFLIFPLLLHAKTYIISGGHNNVAHKIAEKVLKKAYLKAGLQMKRIHLRVEESLEKSNSGEIDGDIARSEKITQFYPNLRKVPVELIEIQAVAFSKNPSLRIQKWRDLQGHSITIVKGIKFIEEGTKDIPRQSVHSIHEAMKSLENNKTEIIVIPRYAGINLKFRKQSHLIKQISHSLQTLPLYHFLNKKNAHLIPILTSVLQEMQQSGEINYIHKSYLKSLAHD